MFPFGNSNPILHFSVQSSFRNSNSSFLGLNGNQILLPQHQDQFPTHHYNLAPNGLDNNNNFATNNVMNTTNQHPLSIKIKKTVKKDRHSKILTSQGHRDRRVRLSIGVARKFFDLQDMLGFDKPSKTLDWLFTKSKLAIEELTDQNADKIKSGSTPSSINSGCEDREDVVLVKDETVVARELRAKARARARERTMKKMWRQIEAKSNTSSLVKEQMKIEEIKNMIHQNQLSGSEEAVYTRNWDHDEVNRTTMAATICCTSTQVQKAWDTFHHGSQL